MTHLPIFLTKSPEKNKEIPLVCIVTDKGYGFQNNQYNYAWSKYDGKIYR